DPALPEGLALADAMMGLSLHPLIERFGLTLVCREGLEYAPQLWCLAAPPALCSSLAAALDELVEEVAQRWDPASAGRKHLRVAMATLAANLAACVVVMRRELYWSSLLHCSGGGGQSRDLPSLTSYLAVAKRSTGIHPTAALIYGFGGSRQCTWGQMRPAIAAAARVIRLANDLHTFEADIREGHLTAFTMLALRKLDFPLSQLDPKSRDTLRTKRRLMRQIDRAVNTFGQRIAGENKGLLA